MFPKDTAAERWFKMQHDIDKRKRNVLESSFLHTTGQHTVATWLTIFLIQWGFIFCKPNTCYSWLGTQNLASPVQGVGQKSNSYKFWDIRNGWKKWTDDSEYLCMRNPFNKVLGWIFNTIPLLTLGYLLWYTGVYLCISSTFEKASCHILTTYNQPRAVLLKLLLILREMEEKHLVCVLGNSYKQSCQAKLGAVFHIKATIYFNKVHRDTQK